ncbi:MAG: hypothetical protein LBQ24_00225 [Candidatus Peribacteria bacterium]|nr:hypothetical protein [Candidatus Peribacteria bacterium]
MFLKEYFTVSSKYSHQIIITSLFKIIFSLYFQQIFDSFITFFTNSSARSGFSFIIGSFERSVLLMSDAI